MLTKERNCTNGTLSRCTYAILLLVAIISLAFSSTTLAQDGDHGLGSAKGCSPTQGLVVGDPVNCRFTVENNSDTGAAVDVLDCTGSGTPYPCCTAEDTGPMCGADTLTVTGVEDNICTGGLGDLDACLGPVSSGDILSSLTWTLTGGATCNDNNPPGENTNCVIITLPADAKAVSNYQTHYNVQAGDPTPLPDRVRVTWNDLCTSQAGGCPGNGLIRTDGSQVNIVCPTCGSCKTCSESTGFVCVTDQAQENQVCNDFPNSDQCSDDLCIGGVCLADQGAEPVCTTADGECFVASCNTTSGFCTDKTPSNENTVCDEFPESDQCSDDLCIGGLCLADQGPEELCDGTGEECFTCNTSDGACTVPVVPEADFPECYGEEICRTPGFWGSRGGEEKGVNITLAVIGDGLVVCGLDITDTDINSGESAIEAICINKGDPQAKLMRHLTAASLNCELSQCSTNTEALLTYCNGICLADNNDSEISFCSDSLDCWNNGGHVNDDMTCLEHGATVCSLSGITPCASDADCDGAGDLCGTYDDCHEDTTLCDSNFPEFCKPGPASGPKKCNEARKTTGYIWDLPE